MRLYLYNEQVYQLSPGTGIIVNTNRLHFGYGVDDHDCVFLVLLLHPSLLGGNAYIESHYLNPLLYDANSDAILLSEDVAWQNQALLLIKTLFQLGQQQPAHYEFQIPIQFASLWLLLYENAVAKSGSHQRFSTSSSHLKEMIGYIQKHYPEKISLHDIASAGLMCRSKCCRLFKQTLHQTPVEYLLHYRIQKSLSLLTNGNLTITDIAAACGFNGASYYTEVFRKIIGISPVPTAKADCRNAFHGHWKAQQRAQTDHGDLWRMWQDECSREVFTLHGELALKPRRKPDCRTSVYHHR